MAKNKLDENLDALSEGLQSLADRLQDGEIMDTLDILTKSFNVLSEGLVSEAKKLSREKITSITSTFGDINTLLSDIQHEVGGYIGFENLNELVDGFERVMGVYSEIEEQNNMIADKARDIGNQLFSGIDDAFRMIERLPGGEFLYKALNLDGIKDEIQTKLTDSITNSMLGLGEGFASFGGIAIGIIRGIGTAMWTLLTNPVTWIIAAIGLVVLALKSVWDMFTSISEEAENLRLEVGLTGGQTEDLAIRMERINLGLTGIGVGMENVTDSVKGLVSEYGNLGILTDKNIEATSIMQTQMGLTGGEAAKLLAIFGNLTDVSGSTLLNNRKLVSVLSDAANVAPGAVMKDIAENAEFAYTYFRGNTRQLAQAAVNARRLGLNLNSISSFVDSIMDFDTSLENELEASLLLGRSINFNKARYLAFQGDIEGATNEILKQIPALNEFNRLNFIQKKALATATGLSVEALTEAIQLQDKYNKNPGLREFEENQQQAMAKLTSAWESISDLIKLLLLPVIGLVADGINWIAKGINKFTKSIRPFINLLSEGNIKLGIIGDGFSFILDTITEVYDWVKNRFGPVFDSIFNSDTFKKFNLAIKQIGSYMMDTYEVIAPIIKAIGYLIGGTIGVALVGIGILITDIVDIFNNIVPPIFKVLSGIVNNIINVGKLIYGIFTGNTEMIKSSFYGIYDSFVQVWEGVVDFLKGIVVSIYNLLKQPFELMMSLLSNMPIMYTFSDMFDGIVNIFNSIINFIVDAGITIYDIITLPFRKAWEFISSLPLIDSIFGNNNTQLSVGGGMNVAIPTMTHSEQVSSTPINIPTQTIPQNQTRTEQLSDETANRLIESNNAISNQLKNIANNNKMQINIDGRKAGELIGNSSLQHGEG